MKNLSPSPHAITGAKQHQRKFAEDREGPVLAECHNRVMIFVVDDQLGDVEPKSASLSEPLDVQRQDDVAGRNLLRVVRPDEEFGHE
jgi:hypothetical protein